MLCRVVPCCFVLFCVCCVVLLCLSFFLSVIIICSIYEEKLRDKGLRCLRVVCAIQLQPALVARNASNDVVV